MRTVAICLCFIAFFSSFSFAAQYVTPDCLTILNNQTCQQTQNVSRIAYNYSISSDGNYNCPGLNPSTFFITFIQQWSGIQSSESGYSDYYEANLANAKTCVIITTDGSCTDFDPANGTSVFLASFTADSDSIQFRTEFLDGFEVLADYSGPPAFYNTYNFTYVPSGPIIEPDNWQRVTVSLRPGGAGFSGSSNDRNNGTHTFSQSNPSPCPSESPSTSPSISVTPSTSATPSISVTPSTSVSSSDSVSSTPSTTPSSSISVTPSVSTSPSITPSSSVSISASPSTSVTSSPSISLSASRSKSATPSPTPSSSSTPVKKPCKSSNGCPGCSRNNFGFKVQYCGLFCRAFALGRNRDFSSFWGDIVSCDYPSSFIFSNTSVLNLNFSYTPAKKGDNKHRDAGNAVLSWKGARYSELDGSLKWGVDKAPGKKLTICCKSKHSSKADLTVDFSGVTVNGKSIGCGFNQKNNAATVTVEGNYKDGVTIRGDIFFRRRTKSLLIHDGAYCEVQID